MNYSVINIFQVKKIRLRVSYDFAQGHRAKNVDLKPEQFKCTLCSWASLIAQLVKNPPAMQETPFWFLNWEDPLERDRLPTPVFLGFPYDSAGKVSACNLGNLGLIPGLGRSPGEGKGYPLQYSSLENSMDCIIHGLAKSWTWLSDFHFMLLISICF